jgi:hypothetical protein
VPANFKEILLISNMQDMKYSNAILPRARTHQLFSCRWQFMLMALAGFTDIKLGMSAQELELEQEIPFQYPVTY